MQQPFGGPKEHVQSKEHNLFLSHSSNSRESSKVEGKLRITKEDGGGGHGNEERLTQADAARMKDSNCLP